MRDHDKAATILTGVIVIALLMIISISFNHTSYTIAERASTFESHPPLFAAPSKFLVGAWREWVRPCQANS